MRGDWSASCHCTSFYSLLSDIDKRRSIFSCKVEDVTDGDNVSGVCLVLLDLLAKRQIIDVSLLIYLVLREYLEFAGMYL